MNFHIFLRSRSSVRHFKTTPVENDVLIRIFETAIYAPSAHNRQPWRFTVITLPEQKRQLGALMADEYSDDLKADGLEKKEIEARILQSQNRITNAPVVVILSMDPSEMDVYTDAFGKRADAERTMAIQSVAAAGLQFQLAARAEGLDSVWTCGPLFAQTAVRRSLGLPKNWEPQAMFFLGYAINFSIKKQRKPLGEVVQFL